MNLNSLNKSVPSRIFKRGQDYFLEGSVGKLKEASPNHYHVTVDGTYTYSVLVKITEKLDILSSDCDCPHAKENFCKHQVAVSLAIKNKRSPSPVHTKKRTQVHQPQHVDDSLNQVELSDSKNMVKSSIKD